MPKKQAFTNEHAVTGAAGFIGQLLAEVLLNDPTYTLLLTDIIEPPIPKNVKYP